jgi:hypothetical protein
MGRPSLGKPKKKERVLTVEALADAGIDIAEEALSREATLATLGKESPQARDLARDLLDFEHIITYEHWVSCDFTVKRSVLEDHFGLTIFFTKGGDRSRNSVSRKTNRYTCYTRSAAAYGQLETQTVHGQVRYQALCGELRHSIKHQRKGRQN